MNCTKKKKCLPKNFGEIEGIEEIRSAVTRVRSFQVRSVQQRDAAEFVQVLQQPVRVGAVVAAHASVVLARGRVRQLRRPVPPGLPEPAIVVPAVAAHHQDRVADRKRAVVHRLGRPSAAQPGVPVLTVAGAVSAGARR